MGEKENGREIWCIYFNYEKEGIFLIYISGTPTYLVVICCIFEAALRVEKYRLSTPFSVSVAH